MYHVRYIIIAVLAAVSLTGSAQQFVVIKTHEGQEVIPAGDIERITLEQDASFHARLLPRAIAADGRTQLFGQALQVTGLADSLLAFADINYPDLPEQERKFMFYTEAAWALNEFPEVRKISFTAFVETDDVLAVHGIHTIADLTAYAHRVYDGFYPTDIAITDPTDRRNALNRFVAYHLLNRGSTYDNLTLVPGFFDRELADVADWYQTFLPEGTLKVARPNGTEEGLYLNRRGVQDRPDKYGVKIRGAKIVPSATGELTQTVSNGAYYYIDDMLAYDEQTRTQVLNERWRIDFTTLSADFMSSGLRNLNWKKEGTNWDYNNIPTFLSTHLDNFVLKEKAHVVMETYHEYYWSYGGVEVNVYPQDSDTAYDLTLGLPMLPEGDYELRLGVTTIIDVTKGLFSMNGVQLGDTVKLSSSQRRDEWETLGWRTGLPEDEQRAADRELRANGWIRGVREFRFCTMGQNSGQTVATPTNSMAMCDAVGVGRRILGRFHSDGRTPLQLRIQSIPYMGDEVDRPKEHYRHFALDFLELCPTWIVDNKEIPEE